MERHLMLYSVSKCFPSVALILESNGLSQYNQWALLANVADSGAKSVFVGSYFQLQICCVSEYLQQQGSVCGIAWKHTIMPVLMA